MQYDYGKNKEEHPDPIKAEVKGLLPDWLEGTLVRNGPGLFSVGETSYNHWFDGMALLHSFSIKNGELTYRSKFLRGDTFNSNMQANRIVVSEMGTMAYPDPCKNIFSKVITFLSHTIPDFTDNCANNIIKYGNDYHATSETNYIRKIDPVTLETQDKVDYLKHLPVNMVASHTHYDKEGNSYSMGTSIAEKGKTKYTLFKVPGAGGSDQSQTALKNVEVVCTVPCRSLLTPSYHHSFGMTDNYFIFIEQPLKLDILKMATAYLRKVSWASCMKFNPEESTLIHLIDRKTKKEVGTKFYTGAMCVYHQVNAFEDDGHVVCDVIAYDDNGLYDMFYLAKLKEPLASDTNPLYCKPRCKRFVLPLSDKGETGEDLVKLEYTTASAVKEKDGKVLCQGEVLFDGVELPRINYIFNGRKYRYAYACLVDKSPVAIKIVKLDVVTKQQIEWTEEDCFASESVFVPRPNAVDEDDGVVLTSVINTKPGQRCFLLVLDGKSFKEVARAYVDAEFHMDMHGYFIPDSS
ncbi:beta,beta-carotene 15,15'-dioxygenase [Triplophysa rosa]|uniref:B n=1 Tax=Triplophysa rosa TaxID=992332 RepID=A0A9W8CCD7_TRIRA|nr:beta,beta-carotene 15,15'-dioxygenase [Triplophysa rosa]KAI7814318.1 putative b [Triplophysa rosa]